MLIEAARIARLFRLDPAAILHGQLELAERERESPEWVRTIRAAAYAVIAADEESAAKRS